MKQKDKYTFEELCTSLTIPVSEFCRRAGVTEGTLARLRQGFSARRVTVNKLLETFSKIYGIELSLDNVTGLDLEDKKAIRQKMLASKGIEKAEKTPVSTPLVRTPRVAAEKAPTRDYKPRDTGLPDGCILAIDFARNHNVKRETFRDHMVNGLGPGLIGMSTDTIPERDRVAHETRPKPGREKETERYLTQEQQHAALEFWKRHSVDYSECDQAGCYCHTLKQEN